MYPDIQMHIAGAWAGLDGRRGDAVLNPATGEAIGRVPLAGADDLDRAAAAAERGFRLWRQVPAMERYRLLRRTAAILRERVEPIARLITLEQGRPLADARMEATIAGDVVDWFAEEARRTYGRVIPGRSPGVHQYVVKEPVGPVAAFATWNVPVNHVVRKVSAALAAGCSVVIKGSEETPASAMETVRAYLDAGLPADVLNLVFGVPEEVSGHLIPHPAIRKVTFTGSTAVGKTLASLAGLHMKRVTMELGGHAPAIVCEDADLDLAVRTLAMSKFRNAGQICIAPSRFLVHEAVFEPFVERFVAQAKALRIGNGLAEGTTMGPLANARRVAAMEEMVADAVACGAVVRTGGRRVGNTGFFFEPTVLTGVPVEARVMNEEPFGPIAPILPFRSLDEAIGEANRLPYGLAAYAFSRSSAAVEALSAAVESGMVSVNHHGLGPPEVPFGGVKDSGYGSEGGSEAVDAYLNTKFISRTG
ncbi:MAG TPA: NAD-dependent succinate-semialdehyde dehydrogenase [Azospirillum sp.]|nr:NAD-dependent succinate-semialdehyde dehydrogenase [Azospirillum sp.]